MGGCSNRVWAGEVLLHLFQSPPLLEQCRRPFGGWLWYSAEYVFNARVLHCLRIPFGPNLGVAYAAHTVVRS
jgi:hypothetical protein